ncbi:hypothetical protein [Streptomyces mirabilis]
MIEPTTRKARKTQWWRRAWAHVQTAFYSLWLSPFRRLMLLIGASLVLIFALLFVFVVSLSSFKTAYELTLGLSSAFAMKQQGALPRSLGGILGVFGWIALPTVIGIVAGGLWGRRLEGMKDLSPEEIKRGLFGPEPPSDLGE